MGIDVIVCAKNREKVMNRVLNQIKSEIPVENLIIIYGTSFDRTKEIALQHTDEVHWDEDKGLGAARHLGLLKSSTEIVAMIDTDIVLPKDWYQKLIKHFDNPKVAAVVGTCIYGHGCTPLRKFYESCSRTWEEVWSTSNVLLKRDAVLEVGNFNKKIKGAGEDFDLHIRLTRAGFEYIWEKDVIVHHPMGLLEHLKRTIWWAKGITAVKDEKAFTPLQLFSRLIDIIKRGFIFATIHPVLFVYTPVNEIIWLIIEFRIRSQRQKNYVLYTLKNKNQNETIN